MMRKFAMDNDLDPGVVQSKGSKGAKKPTGEGKKRKSNEAQDRVKKVKGE